MLGEAVPGLVWVSDDRGTFTFVNPQWEDYTGSSLDQLNALGWEVFIHPDDAEPFRTRWSEAKGREQPFEMELRYRRADGAFCWLLTRVAPLFSLVRSSMPGSTTGIDIEESETGARGAPKAGAGAGGLYRERRHSDPLGGTGRHNPAGQPG